MKVKKKQKILKKAMKARKKLEKSGQEQRLLKSQRSKAESENATDSLMMKLQYQMKMKKIMQVTSKTNTIDKKTFKRKRSSI